jgi:hypothetical protein
MRNAYMSKYVPEIRSIVSLHPNITDLGHHATKKGEAFAIPIDVEIGLSGSAGQDIFHLTVVSPAFLQQTLMDLPEVWGRGYLIMDQFSYGRITSMLEQLCQESTGTTWVEIAAKLNKFMPWEFDEYDEIKIPH